LVAVTQSAIPDLIVAAILAGLFFRSSYSIIGQALEESGGWRNAVGLSPVGESQ
jgi:Co/Zn/Cd efflux system component